MPVDALFYCLYSLLILGVQKLLMSRFWRCWRDAVLGVLSAAWLVTQVTNNNAMHPSVHPKMGYWQFLHPLAGLAACRGLNDLLYRLRIRWQRNETLW